MTDSRLAITAVTDALRAAAADLNSTAAEIEKAALDAGRVRTIADSLGLMADRLEDVLRPSGPAYEKRADQ